jgi:FMN phosphatase YigB (HAD superfamily)
MPIQGVVFDLGHTLMHLAEPWPVVFERGIVDLAAFLAAHRPDMDGLTFARTLLAHRREEMARASATLREVTARESMRWTFAQAGVPDPDPALVDGAIDAFFAYEDACWFPDPDALVVLEALAGRGLRLGLFSNATHDPFIQHIVDRLGFRQWLHPVLSSSGVGVRKPDPAVFGLFPVVWNLPPGSIAVVGDTLGQDILGAQRAGMRGVWYRSSQDARQDDLKKAGGYGDAGALDRTPPDALIDRLGDLPACLEAF